MGKYGITSASQLIDVSAITNGCNSIKQAAEAFERCSEKVKQAADMFDGKALSVDKTTMQPQLTADAEFIKSLKAQVDGFVTEVIALAASIRAEQEAELAEYEEAQRRAAEAAAAQANTAK